MRRLMLLLGTFALAGCASQLQYDLGRAERPCHGQEFSQKSALAQCLTRTERPVWAKDDPQTIALYDEFATSRAELAKERDAGTITEEQYDQRLKALAQDLRARIGTVRQSPD